jgi:hypothetical protein
VIFSHEPGEKSKFSSLIAYPFEASLQFVRGLTRHADEGYKPRSQFSYWLGAIFKRLCTQEWSKEIE